MHALTFLRSERTWAHRHLLIYALPTFFIALAETGMGYIFPVIVVSAGNTNTMLGLIFGISAIMGILGDIVFPHIFKEGSWRAQFLVSIGLALLFPVATLAGILTGSIWFFLLGSICWYVYYELLLVSEQNFVVGDDKSRAYTKDWGIIYLVYTLGSIIGPIVVARNVNSFGHISAPIIVLIFTLLSFVFAVLATLLIRKRPEHEVIKPNTHHISSSYISHLRYFKVFSSKLFPVILLSILVLFIEQMFWNFGALLGESLNLGDGMTWLIIIFFYVPMLIGPSVLSRKPIKDGKKRLSILAVCLAGIILSLSYFTEYFPFIFALIFGTGVSLSFAVPLNEAVFSDYLERAGLSKFYLLSLIRLSASISFFLSPVITGILSDLLGYRNTFAVTGISVAVLGALLFVVTPRKIRLPQTELHKLEI